MKIYYTLLPIILVLSLTIFYSCNTTEPPPPSNGSSSISLTDISCTEAWVELKTKGVTFPVNVNFSADGSTVAQLNNLNSSDTTVYIDSLLPNKSYQLQAQFLKDNNTTSSNKLAVQTLDTTSNNFTWQTFTFGASNSGGGSLNDVAIIDANNIWAVGEIYMDDSTGQPDPNAYNAVHWDGTQWQVKRIFYYGQCSAVKYPPLKAIFAFNDNEIAVTNGGSIGWLRGDSVELDCGVNPLLTGAINRIWGISNNDFYVVGNSGNIAHYNGSIWQKIQSGTANQIKDIWGLNINSDEIIYCVASNQNNPYDNQIITINNNTANSTNFNEGYLFSIWAPDKYTAYIGGLGGLFKGTNNTWSEINYNNYGYVGEIRGNASNDFFIVGGFGLAAHFNGYTWKIYNEISLSSGNYYSVSVRGNDVAMVGYNNGKAVLTIGKR